MVFKFNVQCDLVGIHVLAFPLFYGGVGLTSMEAVVVDERGEGRKLVLSFVLSQLAFILSLSFSPLSFFPPLLVRVWGLSTPYLGGGGRGVAPIPLSPVSNCPTVNPRW